MLENTGQKTNFKKTDITETKHNPEKANTKETQQNKTTLV